MNNKTNENSVKFGELVMDEMGLYVDPYGNVVDQQTDAALQIKGKHLKFVSEGDVSLSRDEMVFDPLNNQTLANNLFGYYINNRYNESGNNYVSTYATVAAEGGKGTVEVKVDGNTLASGKYYTDSVKYADIMMRMNGSDEVDLSEYDKKPVLPKNKSKKG